MSFYIRKSGKDGWIVYHQRFEEGRKIQEPVPTSAYQNFGFNKHTMSIENARERAQRLNIEKSSDMKKIHAARNYEKLQVQSSIYLPNDITMEFQAWLIENFEAGVGHRKKMLSHWLTAQKTIISIQLNPTQFFANKEKVFLYFKRKQYSLDYAKKLLRMLNLFGDFVCRYQGQYYQPINKIPQNEAQRIRDAYLDADKSTGPSEPLTPEHLEKIRQHLPDEQYRWLYLTVWLGLRPREVDLLTDKKFGCKVEHDKKLGVKVLRVYQPKLLSVARELRWKLIPLFLTEQQKVLQYINEPAKRPLNKILAKLTKMHITCYGGRKGFIDLMLGYEQKLEDISAMMGHASIETSWKKYRNLKRVGFTKVG